MGPTSTEVPPRTFTTRMEKSMIRFIARLVTIAAAGAIVLGGATTAQADPITIGGMTIEAPAEIATPVNAQIAATDQALGQALPVSLPEVAVEIGETAFAPINTIFQEAGEQPDVRAPLTTNAPLSQQWDQAASYYVPGYIAPDAASCTDSGVLESQVACASSNVNDFYTTNGYGEGPQAVIVPEFGVGLWFNPHTGMACGYISGLGAHQCDGQTFYDRIDGEFPSDNAATAVAIHESGHDRQELSGKLDPVAATVPGMVGINRGAVFPMEQSSDCIAGAYYYDGLATGTMSSQEAEEARALFGDLGVEGETSHGSPKQRLGAFDKGLTEGSAACNAFTPGVTVY